MMWFTADLHLGDTNILHDMDRPFDSVEEMNRKVIDAINECVAADDRLYILGDFTYRLPLAEAVRLRERIECQNVTLIRGNHDGDWEDSDVPQIWENVRDYLEIAPGYAHNGGILWNSYFRRLPRGFCGPCWRSVFSSHSAFWISRIFLLKALILSAAPLPS